MKSCPSMLLVTALSECEKRLLTVNVAMKTNSATPPCHSRFRSGAARNRCGMGRAGSSILRYRPIGRSNFRIYRTFVVAGFVAETVEGLLASGLGVGRVEGTVAGCVAGESTLRCTSTVRLESDSTRTGLPSYVEVNT